MSDPLDTIADGLAEGNAPGPVEAADYLAQQAAADLASIAATALTDDGDTFDLPDGRTLRLRVVPDQDASILDDSGPGTWLGLLEWGRDGDYGPVRPDGFTGRARIVERDGRSTLWWEPPGPDVVGSVPWDAETLRTEEGRIRDLLHFGYVGMIVELHETVTDSAGGPHDVVVADASIWGCDAIIPEYVADLVGEVLP